MSFPPQPYGAAPQPGQPYGQQGGGAPPPYGPPQFGGPPGPHPGPYGPPPVMPPPPRRGPALTLVAAGVVALVVMAAGVFLFLSSNKDDDKPSAEGTSKAPAESPSETETAEPVDEDGPKDLTADAGPFTSTEGYLSFTDEEDLWIPELEGGWTRVPEADLDGVRLGFEFTEDDVYYSGASCYVASDRGVTVTDFADHEALLAAVEGSMRAARGDGAEFEAVRDPEFWHYTIDGRAVTVGELVFEWTSWINPETGQSEDVAWVEHWGFVAFDRGEREPAICSYGEWLEGRFSDAYYARDASAQFLEARYLD